MEKVYYAIKSIGKEDNYRLAGKVGYLTDNNTLLIPQYSENKSLPYIREFTSLEKCCTLQEDGSYRGLYAEAGDYQGRTIIRQYTIWYKKVDA